MTFLSCPRTPFWDTSGRCDRERRWKTFRTKRVWLKRSCFGNRPLFDIMIVCNCMLGMHSESGLSPKPWNSHADLILCHYLLVVMPKSLTLCFSLKTLWFSWKKNSYFLSPGPMPLLLDLVPLCDSFIVSAHLVFYATQFGLIRPSTSA